MDTEKQNSWNANISNTGGYDCSHPPPHTVKCLGYLSIYLFIYENGSSAALLPKWMNSISVQWCVQNDSNIVQCQRCYQHVLLLTRIKQALSPHVLARLACCPLSLGVGDPAQKAAGKACNACDGEDLDSQPAFRNLQGGSCSGEHRFRCYCCKPGKMIVNAGVLLADCLKLHSMLLLQLRAISFLILSFPFSTDIIRESMWGPVSRARVLTCSPVTIFNKGMF